jgi:hypothetical protein
LIKVKLQAGATNDAQFCGFFSTLLACISAGTGRSLRGKAKAPDCAELVDRGGYTFHLAPDFSERSYDLHPLAYTLRYRMPG